MEKKTDGKQFKPDGRATLIGSLPATNHQEAMKWIFGYTPDIPLWPQLPANPRERMLNQFVEGLPGIVENDDHTFFDTNSPDFEEEQLKFFEEYLQVVENPSTLLTSRFQLSRDRAAGIYFLADAARQKPGLSAVKGQITGPFTLLAGLSDQDDRLGYYNPAIREMVVKDIAMKASWQVGFLKAKLDIPVLLFIDEPALAGLGSSAFISISSADIAQDLAEVIEAIHLAGGLAGVHVCANTDWSLLLSSEIDILSFDAYNFFDRFITCKGQVLSFLDRGGVIAWGLVPTLEKEHILNETAESLAELWEKQAAMLSSPDQSLSSLLSRVLITPSCGTGSLTPELALRVLSLTKDVSIALRKKYGYG